MDAGWETRLSIHWQVEKVMAYGSDCELGIWMIGETQRSVMDPSESVLSVSSPSNMYPRSGCD